MTQEIPKNTMTINRRKIEVRAIINTSIAIGMTNTKVGITTIIAITDSIRNIKINTMIENTRQEKEEAHLDIIEGDKILVLESKYSINNARELIFKIA